MLQTKRNKLRFLQQGKARIENKDAYKDMPSQIPVPIRIGASVTGGKAVYDR